MTTGWDNAGRDTEPRAQLAMFAGTMMEGLSAYAEDDMALSACCRALAELQRVIEQRPCVCILGEFNSGKSTVANLLLSGAVLPTSVIANTRLPLLVRFGSVPKVAALLKSGGYHDFDAADGAALSESDIVRIEVSLPFAQLKRFDILDTPPSRDGVEVAELLAGVPAVIPVWCTLSNQAWKDSERRIWSGLARRYRHHSVLLATNRDTLRDESECGRVRDRLHGVAGESFSHVGLIASTDAASAAATGDRDGADATGFAEFQRTIDAVVTKRSLHRLATARRLLRRLLVSTGRSMARPAALPNPAPLLAEWSQTSARLREMLEQPDCDLKLAARNLEQALTAFTSARLVPWRQAVAGDHAIGDVREAELAGLAGENMAALPTRSMLLYTLSQFTAQVTMQLSAAGLSAVPNLQGARELIAAGLTKLDQMAERRAGGEAEARMALSAAPAEGPLKLASGASP